MLFFSLLRSYWSQTERPGESKTAVGDKLWDVDFFERRVCVWCTLIPCVHLIRLEGKNCLKGLFYPADNTHSHTIDDTLHRATLHMHSHTEGHYWNNFCYYHILVSYVSLCPSSVDRYNNCSRFLHCPNDLHKYTVCIKHIKYALVYVQQASVAERAPIWKPAVVY